MAHSDPLAWERSVRKNVQLGGKHPVRISQGMSWKGHGASPGNREKRKLERAIRHQGARMGKPDPVMGKAPGPKGLNYLRKAADQTRRERTSPGAKAARRRGATEAQIGAKSRERQAERRRVSRGNYADTLNEEDLVRFEDLSTEEQDYQVSNWF